MSSKTLIAGALSAAALVASALLSVAVLSAADRTDAPPIVVEEIVAKVNGEIVTRGELDKQKLQIEAELRQRGLLGATLQDAINKGIADGLRDKIDALLL